MILKDDELVIIGLINENKIKENIELKEVRIVFQDLVQVGPMYRTFLQQLEQEGLIEKGQKMNDHVIDKKVFSYSKVFEILNSPSYLREVPPVSTLSQIV